MPPPGKVDSKQFTILQMQEREAAYFLTQDRKRTGLLVSRTAAGNQTLQFWLEHSVRSRQVSSEFVPHLLPRLGPAALSSNQGENNDD